VILPDVNVLLHAVNTAVVQNETAHAALTDLSCDADFSRFAGLRFSHLR
jgi:hypothetical protein